MCSAGTPVWSRSDAAAVVEDLRRRLLEAGVVGHLGVGIGGTLVHVGRLRRLARLDEDSFELLLVVPQRSLGILDTGCRRGR